MIDYNVKSEVLKDGSFNNYCGFKRLEYSLGTSGVIGTSQAFAAFDEYADFINSEKFRECSKIYRSRKQQRKRIRGRLEKWFDVGYLYFLTLTFNDDALERTTARSRRRAVSKFLRQFDGVFVANIDYGKEHEREHFHAVLCVEKPLAYSSHLIYRGRFCIKSDVLEFWARTYGFYTCARVDSDNHADFLRISRYLNKLTLHAIKDTASGCRLIYSRTIPDWYKQKRKELFEI